MRDDDTPTPSLAHLAQPGDTMFERNIAIIAMNFRELKVQMSNGYTVSGFVAGMDDESIQVCKTSDGRYEILNRMLIISYAESGKSISDVTDEERRTEIKSHISHFVKVAKAFHTNELKVREPHDLPA